MCPRLDKRTLMGALGLTAVALLALGLSPLLHSASGPNLSSSTMQPVTVTTTLGDGLGSITGIEVQYSGTFYSGTFVLGCSTEPHQCLLPEAVFFFLVTNSSAYRLVPVAGPVIFPDGTRVTVTGILVTPPSLGSSMVWQGHAIMGEIYIQSISAS